MFKQVLELQWNISLHLLGCLSFVIPSDFLQSCLIQSKNEPKKRKQVVKKQLQLLLIWIILLKSYMWRTARGKKTKCNLYATWLPFCVFESHTLKTIKLYSCFQFQMKKQLTWALTNLCRLESSPFASGSITTTVKWASRTRHIQSMIWKWNEWYISICWVKSNIKVHSLQSMCVLVQVTG